MCAKLKCCLNYEVDNYMEASRKIPSREVILQTLDSDYYLFKADILAGMVTYSTDKRLAANLETITAQRAMEIIEMNKRGEKPEALSDGDAPKDESKQVDLLAGESLTRFDKAKKKKKNKSHGQKPQNGETIQQAQNKEVKQADDANEGNAEGQNKPKQHQPKPKPQGEQRRPRGNRPQMRSNEKQNQGNDNASSGNSPKNAQGGRSSEVRANGANQSRKNNRPRPQNRNSQQANGETEKGNASKNS